MSKQLTVQPGLSVDTDLIDKGTTIVDRTKDRPVIEFDDDNVGLCLSGNSGSYASGEGVLFIQNASTVPTGNPSSGIILYSDSGNLMFIGPTGVSGAPNNSAISIGSMANKWKTPATNSGTFSVTGGTLDSTGTITVRMKYDGTGTLIVNFDAEAEVSGGTSVLLTIDDPLFTGKTLSGATGGILSIHQGSAFPTTLTYATGHYDLTRTGSAINIVIADGFFDTGPNNFNTFRGGITVELT